MEENKVVESVPSVPRLAGAFDDMVFLNNLILDQEIQLVYFCREIESESKGMDFMWVTEIQASHYVFLIIKIEIIISVIYGPLTMCQVLSYVLDMYNNI